MAIDWIKMRSDIYRNPKVCLIADELMDLDGDLARYISQNNQSQMSVTRNVMRNATVGALVTVWGTLRHTGKREDRDLVCRGLATYIIDDIADMPGLGDAMASVGWLVERDNCVVFPNFFEDNNVDPAEKMRGKNAERQARYRAKKASQNNDTGNVTHNVTVTHREEKRREENINIVGNELPPVVDQQKESKSKALTSKALVDIGVSQQLADDYMIMRKAKRLPLTQSGLDSMMKQFRAAGLEPGQGIDLCIQRGWASFKAEWLANTPVKTTEQPAPRPRKMLVPEPDKRVPMPESLKALARTL